MNSPFSQLYQAIIAQLNAEVPAIVYIDLDYGQLHMKERPAVAFPCVLVDFTGWRFDELSNLVQDASGNVVLRLATDPYSSTNNITPEEYQEAGLQMLELEWSIYKAFEGWIPSGSFGPFGRVAATSDNRRPGLKIRDITFSNNFQDYSAKRAIDMAAPPPPSFTYNMDE